MKFTIVINCIATAGLFGIWQNNSAAGMFMFAALGFVVSVIDYLKGKE
jgi:hypothetical protein